MSCCRTCKNVFNPHRPNMGHCAWCPEAAKHRRLLEGRRDEWERNLGWVVIYHPSGQPQVLPPDMAEQKIKSGWSKTPPADH